MFQGVSANHLATVDARRILILKPSAMGDVVQTLPLLPALKARFPEARISWLVKKQLADLLNGHPLLDEVLEADFSANWREWRPLLRKLRAARFDLVLDLQGLARTAVLAAATRAPLRVGLETAREGSHLVCHYIIPGTTKRVAAWRRYRRVADALGCGDGPFEMTIATGADDQAWVAHCLKGARRPIVAIHPGAAWETKRWPAQKFAALASRLIGQYRATIVVLGTASEADLGNTMLATLSRTQDLSHVIPLVGATSLKRLASLLQQCDLLVSNDSGPLHLAAGLGTPVIGLFTCTSPRRSGPPVPRHQLVSTRVPCRFGYCKRCPLPAGRQLACHRELTTDRVWRAVQHVLDQRDDGQRAA